jgi:hypothetical protein
MSTKSTKKAGTLAVTGSALWLVALAIYWVAQVLDDFDTTVYLVWTAIILASGVLTFLATLGLRKRQGSGVLGTVGLVILGIGVVVSFVSWATPLWMTIQGVGMLLVAIAIRPMGTAPHPASVAYGSGMLIGAISFFVLTVMKVGTPDSYGDYPLAWGISIAVGLVIVAIGLFGIGRWLRDEEPADVDLSDQAINA